MSDELYDYQRKGVEFIKAQRRVILADEMGLGKTVQAIKAIDESGAYPALIVVGLKIGLGVWQNEIRKWTGESCLVYNGNKEQRRKLWASWDPEKQPYLLVNFMLLKEVLALKHKWKAVVFDEYHLIGLRNRRSATFKVSKKLLTGILILISGSPMSQGPQDLWGPLHLLQPKKFNSFWKFAERFCTIEVTRWGRSIGRYPVRTQELKGVLQRYMVRRLKKNVLTSLPDKTRQAVPIEMELIQHLMYKKLAKEMMLELPEGEILITPSVISKIMALRQLLVSPWLIGSDVDGIGIVTLKNLVTEEFASKNSVAIFTPFRAGVTAVKKALQYLTPDIYTITGGMKAEDSTAVIKGFQENPNKKKILVATIKSAVSFTASEASVAFFLGQEWDHNDNEQAEDRLHRVGQKNAVRIYYLMHTNTIEERIVEVLMDKKNAIGITLDRNNFIPS